MNDELGSRRAGRWVVLAAFAWVAVVPAAWADGSRLGPRQPLPVYQAECADCHLAYPPGLLPAVSWERIMAGLGSHYGVDASIDADALARIGTWLQANAGTYKRVGETPQDNRITRSAWFIRKHRKVDPRAWLHDAVRSAAHCAACHAGAERGDFNDDDVQMPPGLLTR